MFKWSIICPTVHTIGHIYIQNFAGSKVGGSMNKWKHE